MTYPVSERTDGSYSTTITLLGTEYRITSRYLGNKKAPWTTSERYSNYNNHRIIVSRVGDRRARATFQFWASVMNPEVQTFTNLLDALNAWLVDATEGFEAFDEFCSSTGFDPELHSTHISYHSCQRAYRQTQRVLAGDLWRTADELQQIVTKTFA